MIRPKQLHAVEAISSSVRIEKETPRAAEVHLQLAGGEFLSVAMARNVLERLVHQARKAMEEAPPPARKA